jgi:hypothetical protein
VIHERGARVEDSGRDLIEVPTEAGVVRAIKSAAIRSSDCRARQRINAHVVRSIECRCWFQSFVVRVLRGKLAS